MYFIMNLLAGESAQNLAFHVVVGNTRIAGFVD
jgi:hypothetical protein